MLCLMCPFCIMHIDECERTITLLFNAKLREREREIMDFVGDKKRIQKHRGGAILYSGGSNEPLDFQKKIIIIYINLLFFFVSLIF